jgi:DNA polymerase-3 subunit alpha
VTRRRARLFAGADRALEQGGRRQADRAQGQSLLFAGEETDDSATLALPPAAPWSEEEMLRGEKEALGLYLSGHPLERYAEGLKAAGAHSSLTLASVQGDGAMAGIVSGCRIVKTRKGDRMAVFMLEDQVGSVEVVVYPRPFEQFGSFVENDRMLLVTGAVEVDEERAKIRASELKDLKTVAEKLVREVCVSMHSPPHGRDTFRALADVFLRHRGDKRVQFELRLRRRGTPSDLLVRAEVPQLRVRPSADLVTAVEQICGQGSVVLR